MSHPRPNSAPLGLVGIGLLGTALAERLLGDGFGVVGYDLDAARLDHLRRLGGETERSAAAVFGRCRRALLSLPDHDDVTALLRASTNSLRRGQIIIDTTTGDPAVTERLAGELAAHGVTYLDATVSGSSAQVREGIAVIMVGGDPGAYAACADVFARLGCQTFHTGGVGTGAKMKLVTNAVLGLNRAALAEGLALAERLGLDAVQAFAIMQGGPAYSRVMDRKGGKMLKGDFTPDARLSQHLKDVRLILAHGRAAGLPMPLSEAHRAVLESAEAAGLGALDNSAIIEVLRGAGENGHRS